MLAEAKNWEKLNGIAKGLCRLARTHLHFECDETDIFPKYLPELYEKRTTDDTWAYWFPYTENGWKKRIEILKQCINETY